MLGRSIAPLIVVLISGIFFVVWEFLWARFEFPPMVGSIGVWCIVLSPYVIYVAWWQHQLSKYGGGFSWPTLRSKHTPISESSHTGSNSLPAESSRGGTPPRKKRSQHS